MEFIDMITTSTSGMMHRTALLLSFLLIGLTGFCQPAFSLQQCIDSALANNIGVKQSDLSAEEANVEMKQAKDNLWPAFSLGLDHGRNFGRSIDPFTNTYINQSAGTGNYYLGSNITVFNGFSLKNKVKEATLAYDAAIMDWQQSKNNLVLNVILAYLQVLNMEDAVALATAQATVSRQQLQRLQVLDKEGAIPPSQVADLKGQLMNDQLSMLNTKNNLETAKLALMQLMNKKYDKAMKLERVNVEELMDDYKDMPADIYSASLNSFALVKAAALRSQSFLYGYKASKGALYPRVSFGGSVNTAYSSVAAGPNGKLTYGNQVNNNRFYSVGLGVSLPIFNAFTARNRVKLAGIAYKSTRLAEAAGRLQLQKDIDQAYLHMTNALERYQLLLEQAAAYTISFKAAEVRFSAGAGTSIDYLTAKDRLDRANINLVNAGYDFVLRKKILDYYRNSSPLFTGKGN